MADDVQRLDSLAPGQAATIAGLVPDTGADVTTLRRLGALGFVAGTRVDVLRRAPLGDPVEFALRGTRVSLRRSEAAHVTVREVTAATEAG